MSQRVTLCGEAKGDTPGAVAKASLNRAQGAPQAIFNRLGTPESHRVDPKPGELSMGRVKRE